MGLEINSVNINIINIQAPKVQEQKTDSEPLDKCECSCSHEPEYSKMGHTLAKIAFESGCNAANVNKQRWIQYDGFNDILKNSSTTEDEKTLARLGNKFATSDNMDDISAARGSNRVLETITNCVGGPIGSVISKISYEAGCKASNLTNQLWAQHYGFNAIIENSKTTETEKTLANLGSTFVTEKNTKDGSRAIASNYVLNAINSCVSGPIGSVVAKITYDAGCDSSSAHDQIWIHHKGFNSIINNSNTTEEQKVLARLGKAFVEEKNLDNASAAVAGNRVLEAMKNNIDRSLTNVIADITYEAGRNSNNVNDQRWIHSIGFKAIMNNPNATEDQKVLAKNGYDTACHKQLDDVSSTRKANIILEELCK